MADRLTSVPSAPYYDVAPNFNYWAQAVTQFLRTTPIFNTFNSRHVVALGYNGPNADFIPGLNTSPLPGAKGSFLVDQDVLGSITTYLWFATASTAANRANGLPNNWAYINTL